MRFLADENVPGAVVAALEVAGNDVVLAWAVREDRVLLTFDKDFGELAKTSRLPAKCGIILLRVPMPRPDDAGRRIANLIMARNDWAGHFSVVEPGRVRMRPLGT